MQLYVFIVAVGGKKMENTIKERGKVRYALTFAAR